MAWSGEVHPGGVVLPRVVGMMGPKSGRESGKMSSDTGQTDTTPFALPFIGGVVLAVPCRVPQNYKLLRHFDFKSLYLATS